MPDHEHQSEPAAERLLRTPAAGPADDPLVRFLGDVRRAAQGPAPAPSAALARVLRSGFSPTPTDKLATAVSRRSKETQHTTMKSTGFFKGVTGKVVVLGTTLLLGLGTTAAAVALPGSSRPTTTESAHAAVPLSLTGTAASASAKVASPSANTGAAHHTAAPAGASVSANLGNTAGASASVAAGAGTSGAGANVGAGATVAGVSAAASVGTGSTSAGANLGGSSGSGGSGTVAGIISAVEGCLSSVINTATGNPLVAIGSVVPTVVTCIQNVMSNLPVPTVVSSCVNGILNSLDNLPVVGSGKGVIDLSGCVPIDLGPCIQATLSTVGGLLSGLVGNGAALKSTISSIDTCATSIVQGVLNVVNSLVGQVVATLGGGPGGLSPSGSAPAKR